MPSTSAHHYQQLCQRLHPCPSCHGWRQPALQSSGQNEWPHVPKTGRTFKKRQDRQEGPQVTKPGSVTLEAAHVVSSSVPTSRHQMGCLIWRQNQLLPYQLPTSVCQQQMDKDVSLSSFTTLLSTQCALREQPQILLHVSKTSYWWA